MNAELKSLISSNVDLKTFLPENSSFHIPAEMVIGPNDSPGADIFQIEICSPKWLEEHLGLDEYSLEDLPISWVRRPFLMVKSYSYTEVFIFLQDFFSRIDGETWADLASEINKIALWEFDKYRDSPDPLR